MCVLDYIQELDRNLFLSIHHQFANRFFNQVMPLLRNPFLWIPLYLFLVLFFFIKYKKEGFFVTAFLLATVAITDASSAKFIKPLVHRLRPCHDTTMCIKPLVPCGSGFSFPSAHAANHFGIALFLIKTFRKKWKYITIWALAWATSISFAQVYVGVHFPMDVLAGAALGIFIGYIMNKAFLRCCPGFKASKQVLEY